ncbi:uncharacterized protein LOC130891203 [Diorhabda carinulata]|uniref:uncharacterized protein LOC130444754 n=1 Tax=Diorhabda sublineata TaxID=1163346 RepID=UPI0024E0BFDA|nr:uncharacterized protein LOC130444754 [Diorhabda sublineata]XP_057651790.1 uncharacterized protein LOC130891203 [Diorhabda carinulata]
MKINMFTKNITNMWVLVLFTVLVGLAMAQNDPYQKLSDHWFNKCFNQTHDINNFDKLYADGVEFKRYLKYAFKFIPEGEKVFCDRERFILENRMKEFAKDLKPCLAQQEKFLEDFLNRSFKELLHFLCHNDGEHIKTFYSSKAAECRTKLSNTNYPNLDNCFAKIINPTSRVLMKKDICSDLGIVKKCFAEALEFQCPSFGSYKKLNEDFFSYVSKPCSGCVFNINSLLFAASLLISLMFSRK